MTDTRKEFEEFFNTHRTTPATTYEMIERSWHACQSLNDKRIEQLLAVIAKKDALINQCIENNLGLADGDICTLKPIKEALALQPADVELVEVGHIKEEKMADWMKNTELSVECNYNAFNAGDKLYTIKTKANTK